MNKFFNSLKSKLTIGNLLGVLGSLIFAVGFRHLCLHYMDLLPVRGGLEVLDLGYFGIIVLFKFIFTALLEHSLGDKFSIPLFSGASSNALAMNHTGGSGSASSSTAAPTAFSSANPPTGGSSNAPTASSTNIVNTDHRQNYSQ